jgi:hypothetical protein
MQCRQGQHLDDVTLFRLRERVLAAAEAGTLDWKALGETLGIHRNTVARHGRAALEEAGIACPVVRGNKPRHGPAYHAAAAERLDPPLDPVAAAQRRLAQQREIREEREALYAVAGEKSLREELTRLVREVATPWDPPPRHVPPKAAKGAWDATALLQLSDWHAYEEVKRERTQGMNEYGAATFARRAHRVVNETLVFKRKLEAGGGFRIRDAVVSCNGDFVSGTIHEVERHTEAPHIVAAVYGCARTLALGLRDLAADFDRLTVVCTAGNHARLPDHKRVPSKDPTRGWDTLIYLFAREALAGCDNVQFLIPDSYVASFAIGSKRFLQFHGHGIKSWNQIPHYGIGRWTRNNQAMQCRSSTPIDYYLLSHFHTASAIPGGAKTYINGSLIGGTEHSINELGACEPPSQNLLLVADPVGVITCSEMYGEVEGLPHAGSYPVYPWRDWAGEARQGA